MDDFGGGPVETVVEDARWEALAIAGLANRVAAAALGAVGLDPSRHEIGLLVADDARIAALNTAFRGRARATNVLSWPAFDGPVPAPDGAEPRFVGDIALAFETCATEAAAGGLALADHVSHLLVHGVMHLLGHDHQSAAEAGRMETLETKILASLGVADPYSGEERP